MPWFRVDDSFHTHPKVLRIPRKDRAPTVGLWALAGAWCADQLTDGHLGEHMLSEFASTKKYAEILVGVGLWEQTDAGYQFHNWSEWQPTREQVEAERTAARERMKKVRLRRSSGEHTPNFERSSPNVREPRPVPTLPIVPTELDGARKRATKRPEQWEPNETHRRICADLELNLSTELAHFADFHDAKGSTFKDWDAALRAWLRNSGKWRSDRRNPNGQTVDWDAAMARAEARTRAQEGQT